ncbi:MAG TPA: hypothetical protein VF142_02080, partial [Longimicrobium sp.]
MTTPDAAVPPPAAPAPESGAAPPVSSPAPGTDERERGKDPFPAWWPGWARRMADLYFSGTTSVFLLHGNTYDYARTGDTKGLEYGGLAEFLAEQSFGRWDVVLHYDLSRGLRAFAGRDDARQRAMAERVNQQLFDLSALKNDPGAVLALLDRFARHNVMAAEGRRVSAAVVIDHASFLFPAGEPGRMSPNASA